MRVTISHTIQVQFKNNDLINFFFPSLHQSNKSGEFVLVCLSSYEFEAVFKIFKFKKLFHQVFEPKNDIYFFKKLL